MYVFFKSRHDFLQIYLQFHLVLELFTRFMYFYSEIIFLFLQNMPRTELEKILITLLKMEKINLKDSKELIVRDIFDDLEVTEDNLMNQKDFVSAAKQSELLWTIIDDFEQRKLTEKNQETENNFYPPYAC